MMIECGNSVLLMKPVDINEIDVETAKNAGKVIVRRVNNDFLSRQCSQDTVMKVEKEVSEERVTANFASASTGDKDSSSRDLCEK